MATTRPRSRALYRRWQDDEHPSATAPSESMLFKYRLIWANGKEAGRAAYNADIRPGDTILSYRGQWLRVLALTPTYEEESPYDGVLQVEPS